MKLILIDLNYLFSGESLECYQRIEVDGRRVHFEFKFNCKNIISMQLSKTTVFSSSIIKEDNTTATEASSEFTLEHASQSNPNPPEEEVKWPQPKLKYRKLRQKLNSMGFQHDDKCLVSKDQSSIKKQRILKLALDLERQTKIQNRDYDAIQIIAREINKIVEAKKETDLFQLRQSRFIPALFELLTKVPSLHKNEFSQLLKGLDLCTIQKKVGLRVVHSFASISTHRDYLILTNRLNGLISFGNWILGRQEKKTPINTYLSIQLLTFKITNSLLLHKSREEDILTITETTVQLILCSQIFKKIKTTLTELFLQEDTISQTDTVLELLRFMLNVMRRACPKIPSDYYSYNQTFKDQPHQAQLYKLVELVAPFVLSYFTQLKETQTVPDGELIPDSYPQIVECVLGLSVKILNCCCEVALPAFRRAILQSKCQNLISSFTQSCCSMIRYCKREMEQYNDSSHPKTLLNQLIIFIGYISLEDIATQKKLYEGGLLQEIFNLPVQYIMDGYLRDVHIPTFCCLINDSKLNLSLFLKDNSPQPIIKALKKEMTTHPSLSRKGSTCSLVSMAHISAEYTSANYETDRMSMQLRFPVLYWQTLCSELQKHV